MDMLSVELDEILKWTDVGRTIVSISGIFDMVEGEFVFSSSCRRWSYCGFGPLETMVGVSGRVFLSTIRLERRSSRRGPRTESR